jgi:hypothetical protein
MSEHWTVSASARYFPRIDMESPFFSSESVEEGCEAFKDLLSSCRVGIVNVLYSSPTNTRMFVRQQLYPDDYLFEVGFVKRGLSWYDFPRNCGRRVYRHSKPSQSVHCPHYPRVNRSLGYVRVRVRIGSLDVSEKISELCSLNVSVSPEYRSHQKYQILLR